MRFIGVRIQIKLGDSKQELMPPPLRMAFYAWHCGSILQKKETAQVCHLCLPKPGLNCNSISYSRLTGHYSFSIFVSGILFSFSIRRKSSKFNSNISLLFIYLLIFLLCYSKLFFTSRSTITISSFRKNSLTKF